MFNALKYIKSLEAVGFRREQAEAQVQLVMDSFQDNVATKSDMAEMRADLAILRSEMSEFRSEFRSEMNARFAEFKTEVLTKIGAMIIGSATMGFATLGFLLAYLK